MMVFTILLCLSCFGRADERNTVPDWVSQTPIQGDYIYSVGVGESESEADARKSAIQDAVATLFQTVFGVRFSSSSRIRTNQGDEDVSVDSKVEMDIEFLDQIEHLSSHSNKPASGKILVYQLVRIKKAVADRRKRASDDFYKGRKPGHLSVSSDPVGSHVFIDGVKHGETPATMTLAPGRYQVRVSKAGFREVQRRMEIKRAAQLAMDVSLERASGTLVVSCSVAGARLKIDGEEIRGSEEWNLDLDVGGHKVLVEAPGYLAFEKTVTLSDRETRELAVVLRRSGGSRGTASAGGDEALPAVEIRARRLMDEEKWGELIKHCRENRINKTFTSNSYYYEALAYYHINMLEDATASVLNALLVAKTSARYVLACRIYAERQYFDIALSYCDKSIFLSPEDGALYLWKARILRDRHNAEGFFNHSIKEQMIRAYYVASKFSEQGKQEFRQACRTYQICIK